MAKEKKVNFSDADFSTLRDAYLAEIGYDDRKAAIEKIAPVIGHTVRSCIAKLSREKLYIAKTYVTKNGEKPIDKETLASRIAEALGVTAEFAESLTKANKAVLEVIADTLEKQLTE